MWASGCCHVCVNMRVACLCVRVCTGAHVDGGHVCAGAVAESSMCVCPRLGADFGVEITHGL